MAKLLVLLNVLAILGSCALP